MSTKPTGRKSGRPRLSDTEKIHPSGLRRSQFEELATIGARRGLSASHVLREAVDLYLAYLDTLQCEQAGLDDLINLGKAVFAYIQPEEVPASHFDYPNNLTEKCSDCGQPIQPGYGRCVSCAWELSRGTVR